MPRLTYLWRQLGRQFAVHHFLIGILRVAAQNVVGKLRLSGLLDEFIQEYGFKLLCDFAQALVTTAGFEASEDSAVTRALSMMLAMLISFCIGGP